MISFRRDLRRPRTAGIVRRMERARECRSLRRGRLGRVSSLALVGIVRLVMRSVVEVAPTWVSFSSSSFFFLLAIPSQALIPPHPDSRNARF